MLRRPRLAVVALLVAGCSEGMVSGPAPVTPGTDVLDDWGGDRRSMMMSPGTGDFGMGETPGDAPETEPGEGDAPINPESPPEEDPTVERPDENGEPAEPGEGSDPTEPGGMTPPPTGEPPTDLMVDPFSGAPARQKSVAFSVAWNRLGRFRRSTGR